MASNKDKNKLPLIAQSMLASGSDNTKSGRGPVPSEAYNRLEDMAGYLGLGTKKNV
jgi:hypothetical protein